MPKRLLMTLIACVLLTSACRSGGSGIAARLDEYEIDLATSSVSAGEQAFDVRNVGEIAHQLIVLRTGRDADDLPVEDGVVQVDDEGIDEIGQIELVAAGASQELTLGLEPGAYVLICNIAGHYASGMHATLRAT